MNTKKNGGELLFSNRDLRQLIFPLIVEQILAVSVGMVDTIMVSSVGEAATSGVSLVDMINVLFINIFAAVATGGAVVASQYLGQKKTRRACEAADQLVLVTGLVSLVIMAGSILFRRQLLTLLFGSVEEDVMANALVYLILSALSYPFLAVYNSCAALFRSMGNSRISMEASIIMNIINVIGDYALIFIFHWGAAGAASASLVSRMTACFILLYRLRNKRLDIHIGVSRHISLPMIRRIFHIGIPNGDAALDCQLGRVLVVGIITLFGTSSIAANAIANNLDGLGVLPGQAMNLAIITVIGRCVGAGSFEQAEYYARKMMKVSYIINGLCCLCVILTLPLTLRLYGVTEEAKALGGLLVAIHCGFAILLWPPSFCLANVLRAANDVRFPMCVSVASMVIFRIGLSYVVAVEMGLGAVGVWAAMVVDWAVRVICFVWRYASGRWKTFYQAG